ncbi:hypothetical protein DE146DRAFT_759436 [Phaeosphaeria sp. MPI-PUGE-AT-0046c]|nr:hypothetical protein DE146DRAFT_759436 [Phaeosphaeria sp. MPI-PUGE-AT-0046c]
MRIQAEHDGNFEDETEIERAMINELEHEESQQKKRIRQINAYLNSTKPSELAKLAAQRRALEAALREFTSQVQKGQPKNDIARKIESWEDVASTVEIMMSRLKTKQESGKMRRAAKQLRKFCNTVNAHSTALKMLPTNNDYVSIFYGALSTALQASESYTKVMEGLPQALIEINDAVSAIEKRLWLFENDTMKCYAWRMYSQIFSFLGEIIRWYTKRSIQRLVSSFNEHLLEFFDEQVDEIRKLSRLIHDEAELRAQADSQISRLYLEGIDQKFDRFMTELRDRDRTQRTILDRRYEDFHEEMEGKRRNELWDKRLLEQALLDTWEKIRGREMGFAVTEILEGDVQRRITSPKSQRTIEKGDIVPEAGAPGARSPRGGGGHDDDEIESPRNSREAMLIQSANLEDFFDRAKSNLRQTSGTPGLLVNSSVAHRVKSWVVATESQILYTAGTDPLDDLENSSAAGHYAYIARERGIPVCTYSCSLEGPDPPTGRTRETVELVGLVYSLIRQLVELLPSVLPAENAWSLDENWTNLDGTLDTFPQALQIMDALLSSTGHAIIVLIIDRIDLIDDLTYRSSEKWLDRLIELLVKHTNKGQGTILKIWFVSSGSSAALFKALDVTQIVISSPPRRKAGRAIYTNELVVF